MKIYREWRASLSPLEQTCLTGESIWEGCSAEYEKILDRYKKLLDIAYEVIDKVKELHPEIKDV